MGTHWGRVHILDHQGNLIKSYDNVSYLVFKIEILILFFFVFLKHTCSVNEITIDQNDEYVGSCSDDGKVVIFNLYDNIVTQSALFDRPIKCIALEPNFAKTKSFITGDNKVSF